MAQNQSKNNLRVNLIKNTIRRQNLNNNKVHNKAMTKIIKENLIIKITIITLLGKEIIIIIGTMIIIIIGTMITKMIIMKIKILIKEKGTNKENKIKIMTNIMMMIIGIITGIIKIKEKKIEINKIMIVVIKENKIQITTKEVAGMGTDIDIKTIIIKIIIIIKIKNELKNIYKIIY